MEIQNYVDEIKLELTGGVLELEIPDTTIATLVTKAFREIQRYIDIPRFITVPYAPCIDMTGFKYNAVTKVYRAEGYNASEIDKGINDPMYMQQWMIYSNGNYMYNLNNYALNFASWSTMLQIRNTLSTDLSFKDDRLAKKLYINNAYDTPYRVTIEYIPIYEKVEEIDDEYWTDIIQKLSLALTKIVLGRLRTYSKQSNAQWELDGDTMLEEGKTEAEAIRERLRDNDAFYFPVD